MKRILLALALAMALLLPACKSSSAPAENATVPSLDAITLGTDYKDIKATLEFKSHRTDLNESGVLAGYVAEFQKLYPGITVNYEAVTDYAETMTTRLSTPNWGDICMTPTTVPITELANYFEPLGSQAKLGETYNFIENRAFGGIVYGVSSTNNAQGVLYNKKVFSDAGVTTVPKTPDEFLAALQKVKDNTSAIPLYTNFSAGWTMGAWDAYIGGSATGDAGYMNIVLPHAKNPFSDRGDGTGPFAVYNVLYEAVKRGLIEDDPSTTDWESSKGRINNGEIATMVLGSWAIVQMQDAGPNPDDIGYMSFPITVGGKQFAAAGPDYNYSINKNSTANNKIASMLYIKWLIEESNFDYDQGGIPTVKSHDLPDIYAAFEGVEFVSDTPSPDNEADLMSNINVDSEVGLNMDNQHVIDVVEAALSGSKTMEQIADSWNAAWTAAQQKHGA
ncbi:MAG: ABC transporter substrate-binding protein [Clostridiales bacterium]|jgi:ABC-type glycerol-3-phosphate transport system substrate-binding protein|nr:ABC transporter substrate-binding protein [Clostridiales bacterium]